MTDTQLCPLNFVWPESPGPPAVFQLILIQEAKDNTRHKFWDRRYGDIYGKVHQEDEYHQLKCHQVHRFSPVKVSYNFYKDAFSLLYMVFTNSSIAVQRKYNGKA